MKTCKFILIGAGDRGTAYTDLGFEYCPEMQLVAVADPDPIRRNYIKNKFNLPDSACYEDWQTILAEPCMADAAIIATQDKMHYEPAMKAISLGYHLLLEKPIAPTPQECVSIMKAAQQKGVMVLVCHVLRFTPFFRLLKKLIDSDKLGKIVNIVHIECVGHIHQSHSYVRGNWHNSEESAPMILAKSCHDIDILQWLLGERCTKVQSFGGLSYFRRENKPEGAPKYCIDGCPVEQDCPYSALKIYVKREFPDFVKTATRKHSPADSEILETVRNTDYGRCIFDCDNDVVDHQVVNLEYESGATISFSMSAFNRGGRKLRIMGTKGELQADMGSEDVWLYDFLTRKSQKIHVADAITDESIAGGHGGGDLGIIRSFCRALTGYQEEYELPDIATSVENHLVTFAAEASRLNGNVITMQDYISEMYKSTN